MYYRQDKEIWTGDLIEFKDAHEHDGILTNMIDNDGEEWEIVGELDQKYIKSIVIHQIIDKKFAVWQTDALPAAFIITHKQARSMN
jgi:hypothetical protein